MTTTKKLTPFGYFGGKYALSDKIIPLFPEHRTYVEVFGGSGVVLINKKPSEIEVYNDLNEDIYSFYKVLNDKKLFKKFKEKISMLPYSRQLYYEYRHADLSALSPVDRAVMFYFLVKSTINGCTDTDNGHSWRFSVDRNIPQHIKKNLWKLDVIHDRLSDVYIDNLDFRDLIKNWDRPDTFFYLDPPYMMNSRRGGGYKYEMSDKDHNELINIILNIKGKFMLSGYDNPLYSERLSGLYRKDFNTRISCLRDKKGTNAERVETLWANYDLNAEESQIALFNEN